MATEEKLERLLNLTAALVDASRPLSAAEIQQRVAGYAPDKTAFRRTFERDKLELRELGVPIEVRPVPGTSPEEQGYWVDRDRYELPDPGLTQEELAALRLALESLGVGDPESTIAGALRRLGGSVVADDADLAPDVAMVADLDLDPRLGSLFAAVSDCIPIEFDYRAAGGDSHRRLEPWSLGFRRGHWYLEGRDVDRDAPRQFRLDRILGTVALGEPGGFIAPVDVGAPSDRDPWRFGGDDRLDAVLRVAPELQSHVAEVLGPRATATPDTDGWTVFTVEITSISGFRSFVLGLLDGAEVLGPPVLRDDVISWLDEQIGDRS